MNRSTGRSDRSTPQPSTPSPDHLRLGMDGVVKGRFARIKGLEPSRIRVEYLADEREEWIDRPSQWFRADSPSPEGAEPWTHAGKRLLGLARPDYQWPELLAADIRAIEREAALPEPSLDVERLARTVIENTEWDRGGGCRYCVEQPHSADCVIHIALRVLPWGFGAADRARVARLGTGETE